MLLLHANRVVSLDRMIDGLWGEEPPTTATKALQVYISGLRKVLEPERPSRVAPELLVTRAPGYVLQVSATAIDAARFGTLAGQGRALLDAGRPGAACDMLGRALNLWRGPAYEDVAFESFVQEEITRLNEVRATAAENRDGLLALDLPDQAVVDLERMVAENPLRERRWALLALALYRDGRQGEALRAIDRARITLGDELGLELGPDLRRLEHDLLVQSPSLDWRTPERRSPAGVRPVPLGHARSVFNFSPSPEAPAGRDAGAVLLPQERRWAVHWRTWLPKSRCSR